MTDPFTPRAVRASRRRLLDDDSGAATAEYAIATMATVAE
jgi:Flp pilus assembly pilin Flp